MNQSILSQPTVIIVIAVIFLFILFLYMSNINGSGSQSGGNQSYQGGGGKKRKSQRGGDDKVNPVDSLQYTDLSNSSTNSTVVASPVGLHNDNNFAELSEVSPSVSKDTKKDVKEKDKYDVNDLLPSSSNNEWFDPIKVADPKLINTNRMNSITTKKCCTRDFRGDIPIPKDNNVQWNASAIEPGDLIKTAFN
jgi:hypothetical protein